MTPKWAIRWAAVVVLTMLVGAGVAQTSGEAASDPQQTTAGNAPKSDGTVVNAQQPDPKRELETPPSDKDQNGPALIQSRKDKISYAFGVNLAREMKRQKNDVNVDLLVKAMTDALADKQLVMTDEEVTAILKKLEEEEKQDYEHARRMVGEKNRRAAEEFFAENAKKDGIVTLPSGLQYKILKKGEGKLPALDDKIVCEYRGTLLDGREFDSSAKRGHALTLPVKGIMAGWTQALQMMPVGSKWQLFIPSQLAYGEKIVKGIGPNAMLIFEVELLSIEDKTQTASAK